MALSWVRRGLERAQPTDLVFLIYVAFTGLLILAFGWKLSAELWIGLTLAHLAMLAAGLWWSGEPLSGPSLSGFFRDSYPALFVIFLYWELRFLALLFSDGYRDAVVLRLEELLFGEQLALTFSQRFPQLWLSEMMHLFYGLYWVLLPLAGGALYLRGRLQGFRELVYAELVVFFACYLVFIFFPVAGPFYQFPEIGGELAEGPLYRFVHWVLADGGSKGAAFPSSHVAVAVTILLVTWRHDRAVCGWMTPLVIGLTIGTVYGRFHYGIDALAGVVSALALVPAARVLRPGLARFWGQLVGNYQLASPV